MENKVLQIAVIGGGAAGFFGAINTAINFPNARIHLFEKSRNVLSKVKISGGGRCNTTHKCFEIAQLSKNYPRGQKQLKKLFKNFQPQNTIDWFGKRGVQLVVEEDGRMFPSTNDSQTIIDCFLKEIKKRKISIHLAHEVRKITPTDNDFEIEFAQQGKYTFDKVLVTIGGNPKKRAYEWIENIGHKILSPVPSLFTFQTKNKEICKLSGLSVPMAFVKVEGSKLKDSGPLLITHKGFSAPAILKLSAWGARELADKNYSFTILINWTSTEKEEEIRSNLKNFQQEHPKKIINKSPLFNIPKRLWEYICNEAEIDNNQKWGEFSKKKMNVLLENIFRARFEIKGKNTFKEEFVTCGGVDLSSINLNKMESKAHPGLYFAGEVIDIDAVTGGFNFQAAWTTSYIASQNIGLNV